MLIGLRCKRLATLIQNQNNGGLEEMFVLRLDTFFVLNIDIDLLHAIRVS